MAGFVIGVSMLWLMICPPEPWAWITGLLGIGLGCAMIYIRDRSQ